MVILETSLKILLARNLISVHKTQALWLNRALKIAKLKLLEGNMIFQENQAVCKMRTTELQQKLKIQPEQAKIF